MPPDRKKLLDTSRDVAQSVAGTLKTAASEGREAASRGASQSRDALSRAGAATKQRVLTTARNLTDDEDDGIDQEQARLGRARQEARREATREAQREFREEFRENIFDEAYDAELTRLRRQEGITPDEDEQQAQQRAQATEPVAQPSRSAAGLLGFGGGQRQPAPRQQPRQRQPAQQTRPEPEPQPQGAGMALFGVPQGGGGQGGDPMAIFGGFGQQQQDDGERRDPLFGMQY